MQIPEDVRQRAEKFAGRYGLALDGLFGSGVQGTVFKARSQETGAVALKVHLYEDAYIRERDVYFRLLDKGIFEIHGSAVPILLEFDDELLALEMTVVHRPYVLDFGGAYLDWAPEFSEEVMGDWHAEKSEEFGARWAAVQAILRYLEGLGIFVTDVHSRNISWPG